VPAPGDYDDGEIGAMIGRGNRSTRRTPDPVPLCQIRPLSSRALQSPYSGTILPEDATNSWLLSNLVKYTVNKNSNDNNR
jgi:hypothetical protein